MCLIYTSMTNNMSIDVSWKDYYIDIINKSIIDNLRLECELRFLLKRKFINLWKCMFFNNIYEYSFLRSQYFYNDPLIFIHKY
jgi:hypothetical protein